MSEYGLPIDTTNPETAIMVEAALDWIDRNTSLHLDREVALPSSAKLFVVKYCELMSQSAGVASESLGGMSQSFTSAEGIGSVLAEFARQIFGDAYKGRNRFVAASGRWK